MGPTALFLSASVTKLTLLRNGLSLSTATGFFIKRAANWFLVSNWHVLSGRNAHTGQCRLQSGATPTHCQYEWLSSPADGPLIINRTTIALDDVDGDPLWYEHPMKGQEIDVAAISISVTEQWLGKDLFGDGNDEQMLVDATSEVFLPGYPLGLTAGGSMPIWKRASVASSLEVGADLDLYFYVDTASREGMSGSPCFAISNRGYYARENPESMRLTFKHEAFAWRLMGIYSGRLNAGDQFEAQIGKVWRAEKILDVIDGRKPGAFVIR